MLLQDANHVAVLTAPAVRDSFGFKYISILLRANEFHYLLHESTSSVDRDPVFDELAAKIVS